VGKRDTTEVSRNPENGKFGFASITDVEYAQLGEDGGICLGCDNVQTPIEPDARHVTCESCGKPFVYGVGELLLMGRIKITAEAIET
jgi:ribosomal protein S27E